MPYVTSSGIRLYYEETGRGIPIVFVHEFVGDLREWEGQLRHFGRRYRCIAFNARGYPPSDVPAAAAKYSHLIAADDIAAVTRRLRLPRPHVIGCSMGAYATLMFGLRHPRLARSLTVVGVGSGSERDPARRAHFLGEVEASARRFEEAGLEAGVQRLRNAPSRVQLEGKDPRAFREYFERFLEHSALGHANTQRGALMRRPSIYSLERPLARLRVPLHVVVGDEDDNALGPSLFIKRVCPAARLTVVPATGHVVNVEEPACFDAITEEFLALVESGRWRPRDPRALNRSTMAGNR